MGTASDTNSNPSIMYVCILLTLGPERYKKYKTSFTGFKNKYYLSIYNTKLIIFIKIQDLVHHCQLLFSLFRGHEILEVNSFVCVGASYMIN